ncbi:1-phosphatidylinositol-3-phosphate 5-kinase FAB1B-like [Forsythia ovata]|uniref:1-phosphatidylinositol-3-phosphate 5-kinase FAB1B-like n=1 Tax=Forsythia ovata TaxID=205694 RepID=A0ABD1SRI7_9LAMI
MPQHIPLLYLAQQKAIFCPKKFYAVFIGYVFQRQLYNKVVLLSVGSGDTVVPVFDDEPTSIISCALALLDSKNLILEELAESSTSLPISDSANFISFQSFDNASSESLGNSESANASILSKFESPSLLCFDDSFLFPKPLHLGVCIWNDGPPGKIGIP